MRFDKFRIFLDDLIEYRQSRSYRLGVWNISKYDSNATIEAT